MSPPSALEGRNLNSLGFQPQVEERTTSKPWKGGLFQPTRSPLRGLGWWGPVYLGLKPQAIQIPPLRGEEGTGEGARG